jgi:hypothetical protein
VLGLVLGVLIILAIVALWVVRGRRHERAQAEGDMSHDGVRSTWDDDRMEP